MSCLVSPESLTLQRFGVCLFGALLLIGTDVQAQLVTDNAVTPEQALVDFLLGEGVEVSNITFSGDLNQIGSFDASATNIDIPNGIMLATGNIDVAIGPNDVGGAGLGGGNFGAGDADLTALSTFNTNDAAILEFDFVPTGDSLAFNYIFGSEEYNEYVCGSVNDAFGFFLSGPGINGPYSDNAVNLAVIPNPVLAGEFIPVTINSVNLGVSGSAGSATNCSQVSPQWNLNSAYYVNNEGNSNPTSVQLDGFTIVMTAATQVQCGQTYHIKIAIADAGDTAFDSAVFLEGGSFTFNESEIEIDASASIGGATLFLGDTIAVEGCNDAAFAITRPVADFADTLALTISGTADPGADFEPIDTAIVMEAGVSEQLVYLNVLDDDIEEGPETVTLEYLYINPCGDSTLTAATLVIQDPDPLLVTVPEEVTLCPPVEIAATVTQGYGPFVFNWSTGDTTATIGYTGINSTTIDLTVTDVCGDSLVLPVDLIAPSGCTDPAACNYDPCTVLPTEDYCLLTEVVAEHTEGPLAGMTTYQVFLQALNPTDFVTSVSGDISNPSSIQTTTSFYQDLLGGATPQSISPLLLPLFPELAYDSWVTIGLDGPADAAAGEAPAATLQSPNQLWAEAFDPGGGAPGGDIVMDDPVGGAWYVLNGDANGLPDENGQVLLGQFTTDGVLSGNMQVQVFPEGDNSNFLLLDLPLGVGVGCTPADSTSCDYETCFGCTDPLACNYDAGADFDDGSCAIPGPCDICQDGVPVTVFDNDGDGICDEDEILGCTDEEAYNYDPEADQDDGSCLDLGCIYPLACNYDPEAEVDDGGCLYPEFGEDCDGNCILDSDGDGICEGDDTCIGTVDECGICNGPGAVFECGCAPLPEGACDCDGNVPDATGECGGDCTSDVDADGVCDDEEVPGCTDPAACNFNPDATDDDGSCDLLSCLGCTDPAACNFNEEATVDDGSCALPGPCDVCEDGIPVSVFDEDGDGVCDDDEIPGCTNADANNYDPEATEDDGTCKVFGCTDPESVTYNPFATDEDGSCDYLCIGLLGCTYPDAVNYDPDADCDNGECTLDCSGSGSSGSCVLDYDGNGLIGANDLVYFLSWYELPCEP